MGFSTKKQYENEWEPIPEGWGMFYITQTVPTTTKKKKDPMTVVRYQCIGGHDFEGRDFKEWIVMVETDWGLGKVQALLAAIDPEREGIDDDPENGFDPFEPEHWKDTMLGKPVNLKLKHEERKWTDDDGKEREGVNIRVAGYKAISAKQAKQLESLYGEGQGYLVPPMPDDAYEGLDDDSYPG